MHHPQAGRMSNRHLPAGQAMPMGGPGTPGAADMAHQLPHPAGPPPVVSSGGGGGGGHRGRRGGGGGPQAYAPHHQHHYHHQQMQPMYQGYGMAPYSQPHFYQQMPPQYQNVGMPGHYTMPYPNTYAARSPHNRAAQYAPMVGITVPPAYANPPQTSPALNTPYQPPPAPVATAAASAPVAVAPMPSHTPSSTHSSQALPLPPPPPETPPTPQPQEVASTPAASSPVVMAATDAQPPAPVAVAKASFRPPLPWLSRPDLPFPAKTARSRRRRKVITDNGELMPQVEREATPEHSSTQPEDQSAAEPQDTPSVEHAAVARSETPSTQDIPSEDGPSTSPTTPSSARPASTAASVTPTSSSKPTSRAPIPAVPILPAIPKPAPRQVSTEDKRADGPAAATEEVVTESQQDQPAPPPVKVGPKLWTGLFANTAAAAAASKPATGPNGAAAGSQAGNDATGVAAGTPLAVPSFQRSNTSSLADALKAYRVGGSEKISFTEPRGLINTGNMCYMNSVLQVLLFCIPFYDFLDQVFKKAAHSFKSETPLIDAMVMFMREFRVIDAASSVELLRRRLKTEELEQYGEAFTPEFVYEVIRKFPRFANMRRGHQQDAEEFLGFLLQSLDDECSSVMSASGANSTEVHQPASIASSDAADDWLEVGRKQRPAITRSSGASSSSPITRIFGGVLRSELRVSRLKDSITTEPFQPLQLDIGAPEVRNIVDALKGITKIETLHGDFGTPDGRATKQVFIETLPPVLILHLKRFQFDAEGNGTVKIWKKVGYPLELEIPRDVFPRQKRNNYLSEGSMPRYKLTAVVYHHGKNASGGHYTVDVRRQDDQEWIRIDDTVIRRVRSEDVAEAGAEESNDGRQEPSSMLATAAATASTSANRFGAINDEDAGEDDGWKQVSSGGGAGGGSGVGGGVNGSKRWSSVVNGATTPKGRAAAKDNIKDNKVAYLLFYQRV